MRNGSGGKKANAILEESGAGMVTAEVCRLGEISSATFSKLMLEFEAMRCLRLHQLCGLVQEKDRVGKLLVETILHFVNAKGSVFKEIVTPGAKGKSSPMSENRALASAAGVCFG
jgi:hypothetical protein